jgi:hypothetical protein
MDDSGGKRRDPFIAFNEVKGVVVGEGVGVQL